MKKSFKLVSSLCAALLAVGAGVALSGANQSWEVKAEGTETTIYYAVSSDVCAEGYTVKFNASYNSNPCSDWTGLQLMTKTDKTYLGDTVWSYSFTDKYNGLGCIQFHIYNGDSYVTHDEVFCNTWKTPSVYNGKLWRHGSGTEDKYWVNPDYVVGRYIVGLGSDWTVQNSIYMPKINSSEYSVSVTVERGKLFKVVYYNGNSLESWAGYNLVTPTSDAYHYISGNGTSNIKFEARGTYGVYFTDNNYDGSYKISITLTSETNAEHLAAKLMSYGASPTEGECGNRFPDCKTMFLGLSGDEQAIFQSYETSEVDQFKNAYDRYVAWAAALGQKPWEEGSLSSSIFTLFGNNSEANTAIMVVVIVSLVSLTAVGGFFYYRKRKHN